MILNVFFYCMSNVYYSDPLGWEDFSSLDLSLLDEEGSYIYDETTPLKACGDLVHNVPDPGKGKMKVTEEYEESSSQVKRRRMLQFNNTHIGDPFLCNELATTSFLNARDDSTVDILSEGLDQSSEGWISNCFNNGEAHLSSDDVYDFTSLRFITKLENFSDSLDDHIDITDFCNSAETPIVQDCPTPSPRIIFKGRKSFMHTPTKMTSSVAYPFALIKPCGVHGDVTLKDINQRIHTPPPKPEPAKEEDPMAAYPTSAFSGKPVVVKTKIRTEGGKGSITIMRTKG
ncbi:hypothetical protein GIB67_024553 [Kingdonia uniflora]|uniref:X-ray induced transcript 1 n=1 Tax=Kingdonia uniflora TaxID=39325 RepID=A0A7J7LNT9_9MAGN|nr:hypothetical protein GIB67_024553 [Kingdonia uniflora]